MVLLRGKAGTAIQVPSELIIKPDPEDGEYV